MNTKKQNNKIIVVLFFLSILVFCSYVESYQIIDIFYLLILNFYIGKMVIKDYFHKN